MPNDEPIELTPITPDVYSVDNRTGFERMRDANARIMQNISGRTLKAGQLVTMNDVAEIPYADFEPIPNPRRNLDRPRRRPNPRHQRTKRNRPMDTTAIIKMSLFGIYLLGIPVVSTTIIRKEIAKFHKEVDLIEDLVLTTILAVGFSTLWPVMTLLGLFLWVIEKMLIRALNKRNENP